MYIRPRLLLFSFPKFSFNYQKNVVCYSIVFSTKQQCIVLYSIEEIEKSLFFFFSIFFKWRLQRNIASSELKKRIEEAKVCRLYHVHHQSFRINC